MLRDIGGFLSRPAQTIDWKDTSIIKTIDTFIHEAVTARASDIHIQPEDQHVLIRFRIDGTLIEHSSVPKSLHPELLARIKILAGLRTDEHRKPQDGRFRFTNDAGIDIDIRISIVPTNYGENAILRLLVPTSSKSTLRGLGCRRSHRTLIEKALVRPYGLILATGPTGSGKTTMLYSLLRMLDASARSIITIEDPIEYSLSGITQIPADPTHGLTFSNGLRSILRQDPDVIMVGEIRDRETAQMSANAALTGHVVFSTLHANDVAATLPRLLDLGIERYLIAATLNLIIAQRLVRRICENCRVEYEPRQSDCERIRNWLDTSETLPATLFRGNGCTTCRGTGYFGRIGIFEILFVDCDIRHALGSTRGDTELRMIARNRGMLSMKLDALSKVMGGETTFEEVCNISYA